LDKAWERLNMDLSNPINIIRKQKEISILTASALLLEIDGSLGSYVSNSGHTWYDHKLINNPEQEHLQESLNQLVTLLIQEANNDAFTGPIGGKSIHYEHSLIDNDFFKSWAIENGYSCEYLENKQEATTEDTAPYLENKQEATTEDTAPYLENKQEATTEDTAPYLDKNNPNYAPDLALAIQAWLAVNNDDRKNITFRNKVIHWLEENGYKGRKDKDKGMENNNLDATAERIATITNPSRKKTSL